MTIQRTHRHHAALVLVGLCAALVTGCGGSGGSDDEAVNVCEQKVSELLKSPSSADYSGESASRREADDREGFDVWVVTGSVDSDNSFGASLRSRWTCAAVHEQDGDKWSVSASLLP